MNEHVMMTEIEVKVSGPGGCINSELEIIRRALINEGFVVDVTNSHPPIDETMDEHVDRIRALGYFNKTKIRLIAKHCPWGG